MSNHFTVEPEWKFKASDLQVLTDPTLDNGDGTSDMYFINLPKASDRQQFNLDSIEKVIEWCAKNKRLGVIKNVRMS